MSQVFPVGPSWLISPASPLLPGLLLVDLPLPGPLLLLAASVIKLEEQDPNDEDRKKEDDSKGVAVLLQCNWLTLIDDIRVGHTNRCSFALSLVLFLDLARIVPLKLELKALDFLFYFVAKIHVRRCQRTSFVRTLFFAGAHL